MRDSKGRFKSQGLFISLPSAVYAFNLIIIIFIILPWIPWIYVATKFNVTENLYNVLNTIFFDNSKCNCPNYDNGEFK